MDSYEFKDSVDSAMSFYKTLSRKRVHMQLQNIKSEIFNKQATIQSVVSRLERKTSENGSIIIKEFISDIKAESANLQALYESMDHPFSIFIVGSGKYGKSTLLNALIGDKRVDMDTVPKTWKIDIFRKGKANDKVAIRYKDGSVKYKSHQETVELLKREEKLAEDGKNRAAAMYNKEKVKYMGDRQALIELRGKLEKEYGYTSMITEVIWPCDGKGLLTDFQLVDTPGLNQELLDGELKPAFDQYYNKADGVLWLLDATKISASASLEILNSKKYVTDANVIGVINKIDKAGDYDSDIVKAIMAQAEAIYKGKFSSIVPISSLYALEGILERNDEKIQKSGYYRLINEIKNLFLKRGMEIRCERKLEGLQEYTYNTCQHLDKFRARLNADLKKYNDLKRNFYKQLDRCEDSIANMIVNKLNEYEETVRQNIEVLTENIIDIDGDDKKRLIEQFIRNKIFQERYLDEVIKKIFAQAKAELDETYRYWYEASFMSEYKYIKPSNNMISNALIKVDNKQSYGDIDFGIGGTELLVGFGAMGLSLLLLGPLGLAVSYVAEKSGFLNWASKEVAKFTRVPKIKRELGAKLDELIKDNNEEIYKRIRPMMEKLRYEIDRIRDKSFSRLYCEYESVGEINEILSGMDFIHSIKLPAVKLADVLKGEINGGYKQAN